MNRKTYVYLSGAIKKLNDSYDNMYKVLGKIEKGSSSTPQQDDTPVRDANPKPSVLSNQDTSEVDENSLEELLKYISELSTQIPPDDSPQP